MLILQAQLESFVNKTLCAVSLIVCCLKASLSLQPIAVEQCILFQAQIPMLPDSAVCRVL